MSTKNLPTIEYVRQCLRYEDGRLFWLVRPREHFRSCRGQSIWNAQNSSLEAGCLNKTRWQIAINGVLVYRYKVVWAILKGEWVDHLDHKNRNSLDDKIGNLRPATGSQNCANQGRRRNNTSGYKGVSWNTRSGLWSANIRIGSKPKCLGLFADPADAHAAYCVAAEKEFGEFACNG